MNKEPTLSIILAVYNVEKYITRAINSILSQDYEDYEIILCDDGSTDSSGEICDRFASENEKISVIHKPNGGVSSARNAGFSKARGKYIYFMDPDDYILENLLPDNIALAIKYDADQVVFGFNTVISDTSDGFLGSNEHKLNISGKYSFDEFKNNYIQHITQVPHVVWNRIYKRSSIGDIRFNENNTTADDAEFNLNLLYKGFSTIYYNDNIYYVYVSRQNSIMNRFNPNRFDNEIKVTDGQVLLVKAWGLTDILDKYFSCSYVETMLTEYTNMTMQNCNLSSGEIVKRIKAFHEDARVQKAFSRINAGDLKGFGLKVLYILTKLKWYRSALAFKRKYNPLIVFSHKVLRR
ncbi:MAG: glycosyltransferase family 2 protein [Eubacteriales bacterium]|nr:glycosyltransferase family 2 protein [Eubacteriales bacterium]